MRSLLMASAALSIMGIAFAAPSAGVAKSRHSTENLVCSGSVVGSVSFRHGPRGYSDYTYNGQSYSVRSHGAGFSIGSGAFMHVEGRPTDGGQVALHFTWAAKGQDASGSASCSKG